MSKCCGNCDYRKTSIMKIQFSEIPITLYCDNEHSMHYGYYVWNDDTCNAWKGVDDEQMYKSKMSDAVWNGT